MGDHSARSQVPSWLGVGLPGSRVFSQPAAKDDNFRTLISKAEQLFSTLNERMAEKWIADMWWNVYRTRTPEIRGADGDNKAEILSFYPPKIQNEGTQMMRQLPTWRKR